MRNAFSVGAAIGWIIGTLTRFIVNGIKAIFAIFRENKNC